jgi:T5SS/PEP-CTERM-associated repeat protein
MIKMQSPFKVLVTLGALFLVIPAIQVQAAVAALWNPDTNPGNWSNPTNWTTGLIPDTNTFANVSSINACVVDATADTAVCERMNVADAAGSAGHLIVTNGGKLAPAFEYCAIGYGGNGSLDVENGGTATFPSHLWIGLNSGATGNLTLNGGTILVSGMFGEGWNGGVGHVHVNGGVLNLRQFQPTQSLGAGSTFDVAGGTVIIAGDFASAVNNFVAGGQITAYGGAGTVLVDYNNLNPGATTITASHIPPGPWPRVFIPSLNPNEIVVAATTPQQYGAVGDGITDDSAAFQNAMNAVYQAGGFGGGVVYVPAGNYAFYTNLTIPAGVTLHGDWQDWTKGSNGLVGTTFKIHGGAGQSNATPFIFLNGSTALRDVNLWYPDQNPNELIAYPFTIGLYGDCVVQNVVLVNSYQGIQVAPPTAGAKHILSTVIGTPLRLGIDLDMIADISHLEDIRFSPAVWAGSGLSNAPTAGGAYAAWMRTNGEGLRLRRVDGEICIDVNLSGYQIGIEASQSTNGVPGATFYGGAVSNCATALLAQAMSGQSGLQFTRFTLDGDIAVTRTNTTGDANLQLDHCELIGRSGTAVYSTGLDWVNWMQFQDCTISNTLRLAGPGVFNVVDSTLLGTTQCVLSASATRAGFTGCAFHPAPLLINAGSSNQLLVDGRRAIANPLPMVEWISVMADYGSRQPARTNLFLVTNFGATGNGSSDDTVALQNALAAAGTNGGGIVYLPGGKYKFTNTLDVPAGVELRGPYEMRHRTWPGPDGVAKGAVLQPYGGQGATNGPVALALEANSGLVGLTISYEAQNSNCIPYPPTIQGRGGNVYAIGVVCPNPYFYVDLDTYSCPNHLLYMVDGWALNRGYVVGNGSSGSIVDCQGNWTYWWDNYDSASDLGTGARPNVLAFAEHNLQMYVLGNCTELLVKDFVIPSHTFVHNVSENGLGPNVTGIGTMCDETLEGFRFDAASAGNFNTVNSTLAIFADYPDLQSNAVGIVTSGGFEGTARWFNSALFGFGGLPALGPYDFNLGGGDIGLDSVHMLDHAYAGSCVNGGVLHLINNGAYITYNGASNFPPYHVAFGVAAGLPGKASELIGNYAYHGYNYVNSGANNPLFAWLDYNLTTPYTPANPFSVVPPPLSIKASTNELTISWPTNLGAFTPCFTSDLTSNWTFVTNVPLLLGNRWTTAVPNHAGGGGFFRLQQ